MYEIILKFEPQIIFEEFAQQYIIENGISKFEKIASLIRTSSTIETYTDNVINNSSTPKADDLQYIMNTHRYFMWAKEETICLGALGVILIWSDKSQNFNIQQQKEKEIIAMAKIIDKCSRLKYNQFDSFFHRFCRRLQLIKINH